MSNCHILYPTFTHKKNYVLVGLQVSIYDERRYPSVFDRFRYQKESIRLL